MDCCTKIIFRFIIGLFSSPFFLRFIQVFKAFQRGDPNLTIRIPILKWLFKYNVRAILIIISKRSPWSPKWVDPNLKKT